MHRHGQNATPKVFLVIATLAWIGAIGFFLYGDWARAGVLAAMAFAFTALFLVNA